MCVLFVAAQSGGHKLILDQTKTMLERAMALKPSHVDYVLEVNNNNNNKHSLMQREGLFFMLHLSCSWHMSILLGEKWRKP